MLFYIRFIHYRTIEDFINGLGTKINNITITKKLKIHFKEANEVLR